MPHIKQLIALNENSAWGQKTTGLAIEYDEPIDPASVSTDAFKVAGRTITGAVAQKFAAGREGNFVVLSLNPDDKKAATRKMVGFGPNTKTKVTGAQIKFKQVKPLKSESGRMIPKSGFGSLAADSEYSPLVDDFQQAVFRTKGGKELAYNLFTPPDLQPDEKLPLVVFMHDSSVCSESVKAPLIQGMGALIWVEEHEQEKRRCFVLAPLFPEKAAFDDFTTTWHSDATAELIQSLCETLPIDAHHIYGTGQSMGTMMLCDLNVRYPELFTACFLVAGQWDPERMAALTGAELWILVSEKDEKAFPIMGDSMKRLEDNGVKVARGHLDAKASLAAKSVFANAVLAQGADIQFTWYEDGSVLPDGMRQFPGCFHLCTWRWAYDVEPIRKWLFEQTK